MFGLQSKYYSKAMLVRLYQPIYPSIHTYHSVMMNLDEPIKQVRVCEI